MGSGLGRKYTGTYGSPREDSNASEVREETSEYKAHSGILKPSTGTSNINENAGNMTGKFAPNEYGNFGRPGKNSRIIECEDPVSESASFYEQIGRGGEVSPLPRGNGTKTRLDDGTFISYRVITSSEGSPAVQISVKGVSTNINDQKIHFIKE